MTRVIARQDGHAARARQHLGQQPVEWVDTIHVHISGLLSERQLTLLSMVALTRSLVHFAKLEHCSLLGAFRVALSSLLM